MTERHVKPADDGWHVEKEHAKRPSAKTATQAEAITRASQIVANDGGGQVVIHGSDGKESETRTVTTDTDSVESTAAPVPSDAATSGTRPSDNSRTEHTTAGHDHRLPAATHHSATDGDGAHPRGRHAARRATDRNSFHVDLPLVGSVALPPPDQLAYLGGITTLVAVGILEWTIAALLGAGHLLASTRNSKILADFGEALEEA
jgi:hypothetical protein